jgi:hypothetical protein
LVKEIDGHVTSLCDGSGTAAHSRWETCFLSLTPFRSQATLITSGELLDIASM